MTDDINLEAEIAALEREVEKDLAIHELDENREVEQAAESGKDEWKSIFVQLLGPGFAVLAPNWGVQGQEVEALADAYAPLMAKYFPDASQVGPEVGAILVTAAVIAPRLSTPRKVEDKPPVQEKPAKAKPAKKDNVSQLPSEEDR